MCAYLLRDLIKWIQLSESHENIYDHNMRSAHKWTDESNNKHELQAKLNELITKQEKKTKKKEEIIFSLWLHLRSFSLDYIHIIA